MKNHNNESLPIRWPNTVTYEIFVQSFCDSNNDKIGDIPGVTSKLDYLKDLGIEAIWLMPINPSPSYHKYDVTDYYDIHPDYGTLYDFKNLVSETHKRNIKIIIDLVINHCSSKHPWFVDALQNGSYRDYFVWADLETIKRDSALTKEKTGDSDNIKQWNEVPGQEELYFSFFYSGMPDLNYDNPNIWEEVYKIGKFWLTEIGIDGFRLDAAKHIFPDHRAEDNHAFWKEFKATMESYKPDVYLVGEVWSDLQVQAPYAQGFTGLFNFDLSFSILETVKNGKALTATIYEDAWKIVENTSPVDLYNKSEEAFHAYNPDYVNSTFLTNHDQVRTMSFLGDNVQQARLAASILLTLPGAPYIYYGEELGMRGKKPDPNIREPFLWSDKNDSCRTGWMKAKLSNDTTVRPLNIQMQDKNSMYHLYRDLIHLRRKSDILTYGDLKPADFGDETVLAFTRNYQGQSVLVIHNLTDQFKQFPIIDTYENLIFSSNGDIHQSKELFELSPFESVILK